MRNLLLVAALVLLSTGAQAGPSVSTGTGDRYASDGCPYSVRHDRFVAGDSQFQDDRGYDPEANLGSSTIPYDENDDLDQADCALSVR